MENIILRRSKKYIFSWIILLSGLLTLGVILFTSEHTIAGVTLSISALLSILIFLKGLTDNQPRVIIDVEGITATEFGEVKLLWKDIKAIRIIRYPRVGRIMVFELFDEPKYEAELNTNQHFSKKVNKLFGVGLFHITLEGLDAHPSVIETEIANRIPPTTPKGG
ncbi:MAG: hypothetical protein H6641_07650 [Caldilineaceae bacterium]|nr:hypothetical protein [Caldilineaceae bacterium]